jgi:hypothetical protein
VTHSALDCQHPCQARRARLSRVPHPSLPPCGSAARPRRPLRSAYHGCTQRTICTQHTPYTAQALRIYLGDVHLGTGLGDRNAGCDAARGHTHSQCVCVCRGRKGIKSPENCQWRTLGRNSTLSSSHPSGTPGRNRQAGLYSLSARGSAASAAADQAHINYDSFKERVKSLDHDHHESGQGGAASGKLT